MGDPNRPRYNHARQRGCRSLIKEVSALGDIYVLNQKEEVCKMPGFLPQEIGVYPRLSAEDLPDHFALLKDIAGYRARKEIAVALLRQSNPKIIH